MQQHTEHGQFKLDYCAHRTPTRDQQDAVLETVFGINFYTPTL